MRDDLADLTEGTGLTAQTTGSVPQGLTPRSPATARSPSSASRPSC